MSSNANATTTINRQGVLFVLCPVTTSSPSASGYFDIRACCRPLADLVRIVVGSSNPHSGYIQQIPPDRCLDRRWVTRWFSRLDIRTVSPFAFDDVDGAPTSRYADSSEGGPPGDQDAALLEEGLAYSWIR